MVRASNLKKVSSEPNVSTPTKIVGTVSAIPTTQKTTENYEDDFEFVGVEISEKNLSKKLEERQSKKTDLLGGFVVVDHEHKEAELECPKKRKEKSKTLTTSIENISEFDEKLNRLKEIWEGTGKLIDGSFVKVEKDLEIVDENHRTNAKSTQRSERAKSEEDVKKRTSDESKKAPTTASNEVQQPLAPAPVVKAVPSNTANSVQQPPALQPAPASPRSSSSSSLPEPAPKQPEAVVIEPKVVDVQEGIETKVSKLALIRNWIKKNWSRFKKALKKLLAKLTCCSKSFTQVSD
jgi:hypothetical protein